MIIEALAYFGEFSGGTAVVVSLVYVGVQWKASVEQSRVDSYAKITEMLTQWTSMVASSDDISRILNQGSQDQLW